MDEYKNVRMAPLVKLLARLVKLLKITFHQLLVRHSVLKISLKYDFSLYLSEPNTTYVVPKSTPRGPGNLQGVAILELISEKHHRDNRPVDGHHHRHHAALGSLLIALEINKTCVMD